MSRQYDTQILNALSGPGGRTTGDVAARCTPQFGHSRQTHTAYIRLRLLELQRAGRVKPLDEQKPVCWVLAD